MNVGCVTIDPDLLDSDGDGVLDLPSFGADPQKKDIFLELDWEAGHEPTRIAIESMKDAFAALRWTTPMGRQACGFGWTPAA